MWLFSSYCFLSFFFFLAVNLVVRRKLNPGIIELNAVGSALTLESRACQLPDVVDIS